MKRYLLFFLLFFQYCIPAPGDLDLSFGDDGAAPRVNYHDQYERVNIVRMQIDGSILAGGGTRYRPGLVVNYNADGSLNTDFGTDGFILFDTVIPGADTGSETIDLSVLSDGKFIVLSRSQNGKKMYLLGYNQDGSSDTIFGTNGYILVSPPDDATHIIASGMSIQPDGKIVVSFYTYYASDKGVGVARFHENGSLDESFGTGGMNITRLNIYGMRFYAMALQADGKIIASGYKLTSGMSSTYPIFMRYNTDGSIDTTFGVDGLAEFPSIVTTCDRLAIASSGKIYSVGKQIVMSVNSDGSLNTDFGSGLGYVRIRNSAFAANDLAITSGGTVLVTGYISDGGISASNIYLGSFLADTGELDLSFGDGQGYVRTLIDSTCLANSIVLQDDGEIIVGGLIDGPFSYSKCLVVRYHGGAGGSSGGSTSLQDESFGDGGSVSVYADSASSGVAHQEVKAMRELINGKLMTIVSDGTESWTVRMNADGSYDEAYGGGDGIAIAQRAGDETVTNMELGDVGDLMIVGNHAVHGGYLKRVLSDGSMNPLFGGNNGDPVGTVYNIMSYISSVTQLNNGNMLVVGNHNGVGQAVMLSQTGAVVTEFGTNGVYNNGENITSVSVDSDNNIYMAVGYLDSVKKARIIKMSATGVLDPTFGTSGVVNSAFSGIDSYDNIRLVLDHNSSVVVAASQVVGTVSVARYNEQGVFDAAFNSGSVYDVVISQESDVVVTRVMPLENGKIVISGYEDGELDNKWFVVQLTSLGVLDTEYNPDGDIPGMYTFVVSDDEGVAPKNYDGIILSDGNFMFAGSESVAMDESTPLIIRVLGNEGVQGVSQYPEIVNVLAVPIFTTFGSGGEIVSNSVPALLSGGFIAFGNEGLTNIGGVTNDSTLIVSRFAKTGEIVTAYGSGGIATSPVITNLVHGGMIAVDGNNKVVVGGYTSDGRLVAVRFFKSGLVDTTFGVSGVVQTDVITNLQTGGFVAVDNNNKIVIGGMTSDETLVVARYMTSGVLDIGFGYNGIATSSTISGLAGGGSLVVDLAVNKVFISGYTSAGKIIVNKLTHQGLADTSFGTGGTASTEIINDLVGVGSITLDAYSYPIVGGYTLYKRLAVARFTLDGSLDTTFNETGIVLTSPIPGLVSGGFVDVDNLNRVVIGGLSSILGVKNLVVARFLGTGLVDTTFSPDGLATTGVIENLTEGGPIAVDGVDRILIAGVTIDGGFGSLIGKKLLSGDEIVLAPEEQEAPVDFKIFYYGGNSNLFRRIILVDYYVSLIPDATVRDAVTESINLILSAYTDAFDGQGGFYLTASLSKINFLLQVAENKLIEAYPDNEEEIEQFFTRFQARIDALQR